jgi:hypothetical protein
MSAKFTKLFVILLVAMGLGLCLSPETQAATYVRVGVGVPSYCDNYPYAGPYFPVYPAYGYYPRSVGYYSHFRVYPRWGYRRFYGRRYHNYRYGRYVHYR